MGFFTQADLDIAGGSNCPCGLQRTCQSPRMPMTGQGKLGIFVLAEAPGKTEDEEGVQLVGKAGQRLRNALKREDTNLDRDYWKMNAVNCRPPANRTPSPKEIEACRPSVLKAIRETKPKVLLMLGASAVSSIVGHLNPSCASFPLHRGIAVPLHALGCWGIATFHPSYVERMDHDEAMATVWQQDLHLALEYLSVDLPAPLPIGNVVHITDPDEVKGLFVRLLCKPPRCLAFDYETTGLKPDAEGHEIVSIAVAPTATRAYAFPWHPSLRQAWADVLRSDMMKAAHNKSHEQRWSARLVGVTAKNCVDTQLLAHVADNRRDFTSLEDQAWLRFGLPNWWCVEERFKKASSVDVKQHGANAFNRMKECPRAALLKGNGIDALATRALVDWHEESEVWQYEDGIR